MIIGILACLQTFLMMSLDRKRLQTAFALHKRGEFITDTFPRPRFPHNVLFSTLLMGPRLEMGETELSERKGVLDWDMIGAESYLDQTFILS